ncbi:MAG TPA: M28 family metallopeptidase [Isosphaeraceae bacterium]|jgi:Zn-dependent M28 family amino/carboxypeptidase|nr:M28 family metallopeptidase [Isosphaeraceae bacterium]
MNHRHVRLTLPLLATALLGAQAPSGGPPKEAGRAIDAAGLLDKIKALSADELEGRAPGGEGEKKAVAYITGQFRKMGLKPGNPDGSYTQEVPLVGLRTKASGTLKVGGESITLRTPGDWVPVSRRTRGSAEVKGSEVVFVGYGVVAPEFGWDDYKGLDVRGKTLVMLVNDPPVPDPADPSKLDPKTFRGKAMTYYGRWTYKFEIGSEKGAAAVLLVHETGPAGYPYEVVSGSWGREIFDVPAADGNAGRVAIEAWIHLETAKRLCAAAGKDFAELKAAAGRRDFQPVPLGARADLSAEVTTREVRSRNVVGRLEGSDPKLKDEYVIYTAHWDHLGRNPELKGDQVFNGAVDNASGVAGILEIAEGFAALPTPPKRSILFLAVTAEEQGLLGAKWYASHPLYPLEKTLAVLNIDGLNVWGRTRDLCEVGLGNSTLHDVLEQAAKEQGRVIVADPEPEKGFFYRSDHFEFAKEGVPALYCDPGVEFPDKPPGYGLKKREEYTERDYHKPSDEVKPDWDLAGAVEDVRLLWTVGYRVAQGDRFPEWSPGTEFRARREAMLKGAQNRP